MLEERCKILSIHGCLCNESHCIRNPQSIPTAEGRMYSYLCSSEVRPQAQASSRDRQPGNWFVKVSARRRFQTNQSILCFYLFYNTMTYFLAKFEGEFFLTFCCFHALHVSIPGSHCAKNRHRIDALAACVCGTHMACILGIIWHDTSGCCWALCTRNRSQPSARPPTSDSLTLPLLWFPQSPKSSLATRRDTRQRLATRGTALMIFFRKRCSGNKSGFLSNPT